MKTHNSGNERPEGSRNSPIASFFGTKKLISCHLSLLSRNFSILLLPRTVSINSHNSSLQLHQSKILLSLKPRYSQNFLEEQMDLRFIAFDDTPLLHALHHMLDPSTEAPNNKATNAHRRKYIRDAEAMTVTPADVIDRLNSYVFQIDMPGLKSGDIKAQVEDDNVLVISGDRKAEDEKEGFKYVRKERRIGKLMRKFVLPDNANTDKITAVFQDGVLSVTVEKLAPPQPKKPRTIEVNIA